jgi:hypothetical protein
MFNLLLANRIGIWDVDFWYAVPAIVAISLVYAATRHEPMQAILIHAGRVVVWIAGFMVAVFAVIQFISWLNS